MINNEKDISREVQNMEDKIEDKKLVSGRLNNFLEMYEEMKDTDEYDSVSMDRLLYGFNKLSQSLAAGSLKLEDVVEEDRVLEITSFVDGMRKLDEQLSHKIKTMEKDNELKQKESLGQTEIR